MKDEQVGELRALLIDAIDGKSGKWDAEFKRTIFAALHDLCIQAVRSSPSEADQRDAARYRWIQRARYRWIQREIDIRGLPEMPEDVRNAIYNCDGNALDIAIDAAMSAQSDKEESK